MRCSDDSITAKDTFIRLYQGAGSRVDIDNTVDLLIEYKLRNKSIMCYTRHQMIDTEFLLTGSTLFAKENITYAQLRHKPKYLQYFYLIPNDISRKKYLFMTELLLAVRMVHRMIITSGLF